MYFCDILVKDFSPSSGSLLIWSSTMKYNDTLDEIQVITCQVKKKSKKFWSMLMSSKDITLLLHPVMRNADVQFQLIQTFSYKSKWRNN